MADMAGGWTFRGVALHRQQLRRHLRAELPAKGDNGACSKQPNTTPEDAITTNGGFGVWGAVAVDGDACLKLGSNGDPGVLRRARLRRRRVVRHRRPRPEHLARARARSCASKADARRCRSRDHVQVTPPPATGPSSGLEMDPSHIAAAEVHVNGQLTVKKGAVAAAAARRSCVTARSSTPAALSDALRELFADNDLGTRVRHRRRQPAHRRAHARPAGRSTTRRALEPPSTPTAPDHIPMPMDEAVLDFQSLGVVETPDGPRTRVVIVAVRRDMIDRLVSATSDAGLSSRASTSPRSRMVRALRAGRDRAAPCCTSISPASRTSRSPNDTRLPVHARGRRRARRHRARRSSERRGLTLEHARGWMQHVGLIDAARGGRGRRRARRGRPRRRSRRASTRSPTPCATR